MAGGRASDVVAGVLCLGVVAMMLGGVVNGVGRPVGSLSGDPATGGAVPFAFLLAPRGAAHIPAEGGAPGGKNWGSACSRPVKASETGPDGQNQLRPPRHGLT